MSADGQDLWLDHGSRASDRTIPARYGRTKNRYYAMTAYDSFQIRICVDSCRYGLTRTLGRRRRINVSCREADIRRSGIALHSRSRRPLGEVGALL